MKPLFFILIMIAGAMLIDHLAPTPPAPTPEPTPEQQAISILQADVGVLTDKLEIANKQLAELNKPKPVQTVKPLTFAEAYPETQKTLEELNTAVNKCVDTCTRVNIELTAVQSDIKKINDYQSSCPACEPKEKESKEPKETKQVIEAPVSNYDMAIAAAEATNKEVLFVLRQTMCRFCDELEMNVTHQPYFKDEVSRQFVLSEINISDDPESAKHFNVRLTPAVLVYNPKTKQWRTMSSVPRNIPAFLAMLKGM